MQFQKCLCVSADEKIFSCTYDHTYDLSTDALRITFRRFGFDHLAKAEKCNVCVRTCVRGYCYTYNLNPIHLINLVSDGKILLQKKAD